MLRLLNYKVHKVTL